MPDSLPESAGRLRERPSRRISTDGVHYCVPTCAARRRTSDTTTEFLGNAAAEASGLRPCPHCRPERAPLPAGRDAVTRRLRRASLLHYAAADQTVIADALGVSTARYARECLAGCGVTPTQYAQTQRRLLALRCLGDTRAPLADVARACGYADAAGLERDLRRAYGESATALRRARGGGDAAQIAMTLPYAAPYAWTRLLGFLASRTIDGSEEADATAARYRRTLRVTHEGVERCGWIEVVAAEDALALSLSTSLLPVLPAVLARAWHAFDLGAEPRAIAKALGPLAAGAPGLRLPGTFDAFELVVRAILGQQITVKAARTLASRFAGAFGTSIATPCAGLTRVFPAPTTVAALSVDAIASLGIIGARTRTILAVAAALAEGRLHLSPGGDPARAVSELKALPGIGEWTAQYIAMRALAARDAFPHTDYGVMKALDEKNPKRVLAHGEAWRPYRAYAVMHLWRSLG